MISHLSCCYPMWLRCHSIEYVTHLLVVFVHYRSLSVRVMLIGRAIGVSIGRHSICWRLWHKPVNSRTFSFSKISIQVCDNFRMLMVFRLIRWLDVFLKLKLEKMINLVTE